MMFIPFNLSVKVFDPSHRATSLIVKPKGEFYILDILLSSA
jgi:hypothetical protein